MENHTNSMDENTNSQMNDPQVETPEVQINEEKLKAYIEGLKSEQNLPMGILGGLGAALVGAIAWAAITVITEYQIGFMAVAVGFGVGYAVRQLGKGMDQIFGISGAILALLGCLLGNFFSIIGFVANSEGIGYFELLGALDYSLLPEIMMETFSPMDLLFYGIAVYEGYKFSFRQVTEEELIENAIE